MYSAYVNWLAGATFGGHSEVTLPYLDNYGTKSQHEQFVPQMVRGEKIGAIAMTEPSSGRLYRIHSKKYLHVDFKFSI